MIQSNYYKYFILNKKTQEGMFYWSCTQVKNFMKTLQKIFVDTKLPT